MSEWLLGIDAGGSGCTAHAALRTAPEEVRRKWSAGPANLTLHGGTSVAATLGELIQRGERDIGEAFEVVAIGIAGAGADESCALLRKTLASHVSNRLIVTNDGELLLSFGSEGPAVAVISGTGSLVLGRQTPAGAIVRAGGWGPVLGDDGSAYGVVLDLLRRGTMELDAHVATVSLDELLATNGQGCLTAILRQLGSKDTQQYKRQVNDLTSRKTIAGLFGTVMEFADRGDTLAAEIVFDHQTRLARQVLKVVQRVEVEEKPLTLVLAGGALVHHKSYRERLVALVTKSCRVGEIVVVEEPANGALLLAADIDM